MGMQPAGQPGDSQTLLPPCSGPGAPGSGSGGAEGWPAPAPGKPAAGSLRGGPWATMQKPGAGGRDPVPHLLCATRGR